MNDDAFEVVEDGGVEFFEMEISPFSGWCAVESVS